MARIYWLGLGLVWIGLGFMIVPAGDLKFLTFLLGLALQATGTVLLFLGIIKTRRKKGGALDRKSYIILILGVVFFLVGVIAGFLLTNVFFTGR